LEGLWGGGCGMGLWCVCVGRGGMCVCGGGVWRCRQCDCKILPNDDQPRNHDPPPGSSTQLQRKQHTRWLDLRCKHTALTSRQQPPCKGASAASLPPPLLPSCPLSPSFPHPKTSTHQSDGGSRALPPRGRAPPTGIHTAGAQRPARQTRGCGWRGRAPAGSTPQTGAPGCWWAPGAQRGCPLGRTGSVGHRWRWRARRGVPLAGRLLGTGWTQWRRRWRRRWTGWHCPRCPETERTRSASDYHERPAVGTGCTGVCMGECAYGCEGEWGWRRRTQARCGVLHGDAPSSLHPRATRHPFHHVHHTTDIAAADIDPTRAISPLPPPQPAASSTAARSSCPPVQGGRPQQGPWRAPRLAG
jgi:hypothetical protein